MDLELLSLFLALLLDQIPIYIVWAVGIVFAIVQRKKHPKVSLLASISIIISLITGMANRFSVVWLQSKIYEGVYSAKEVGFILGLTGMISSSVMALSQVLLLIAIFGWRDAVRQKTT